MENENKEFIKILKDVESGTDISIQNLVALLEAEEEQEVVALFDAANRVRKEQVGDEVYLRGIIEFSNYCRKNCKYCGIRADSCVRRYRLSYDEIVETALNIKDSGINTVILQSGEDLWWTTKRITKLVSRIKEETDMVITLSIGEREKSEYEVFKEAGVDKYLLKIESTNKKVFETAHPDDALTYRVQCSKWLKELGYTNGSGCIIGLPEQTTFDIANDILWFKKMNMDMIGIGPFVPALGTPLEDDPAGSTQMVLKAVAMTRLLCKKAFLPATTALETLETDGQRKALNAGANVIMLNFTPQQYRKDYQIYSNKKAIGFENAVKTIEQAGRIVKF
ncbi:[FeFe] hydrogenase H-cluster radical SAM maturase HydE [Petroclostridium sp. X23]|uniref:[FeFe] hydrogenase H-cluster radical SAM maturase HydE n=1 Tax=Petroclostridium sp. X23 TaxID=3045146 RepID=UPI0024ACF52A|nr:[FeFe] hydrogenase H-cluster radical SAM maturase HydE [Petroclostridium sp. X23]WHH58138.1 [FeFe] hydrogenase H-cluster radical SAM maturase HydE [Petroclostridium sp. X23]